MGEIVEVEARPIEAGLAPISGLDALVADIEAEAARLATEYMPRAFADEEDYKQGKRERAGANKDIKALRQRQAEALRPFKDAISEADARLKAAIAPLADVEAGYKREVDAYEERWRADRRAMLAQEYADFAPDLVALVPFERLFHRFGCERGAQWDARAMGDAKAVQAMQEAVESIGRDERTIEDSPYDEGDKAALKADFFSTLDLSGALRRVQAAKEQRERVAELERQRAERRQAQAPEPKKEERPPIDTRSVMSEEEYRAELAQVTEERPGLTQHQRLVREVAGAQTYLVALYAATPQQMQRVAATLGGIGIHGKPCALGTLLSDEQCADLLMHAKTRARAYRGE